MLRTTLNDDAKTRYPDSELLTYALDALREICLLRPDLFTITGQITCVAGVEQTIPAAGWFVVDVFGVVAGDAITEGDFANFRAFNPGWRNDTAGPAVMWMRFPEDRSKQPTNRFYVYPAAILGQLLEAAYTECDVADLELTDEIPLAAPYLPAFEAYVIFRAESKDDEFVNNSRAALFRTAFNEALGIGLSSEQVSP